MRISPDLNSLRANFFFDMLAYLALLSLVELKQNFILKGRDWKSFVKDLSPGGNWRENRFKTIYVYDNKDEHVLQKHICTSKNM